MKILFINASMQFGGAERVISILSNYFVDCNNEVQIVLTNTEATSAYELSSKVRLVSFNSKLKKTKFRHFKLISYIRQEVEEWKPDIVVSFYNDLCALTLIALRGINIPVVYSERNDPNKTNQRWIDKLYRRIVEKKSAYVVFQTQGAKLCYSEEVQKKSIVILNPLDTAKIPNSSVTIRTKRIVNVGRLAEQKNQKLLIDAFSKISEKYTEYNLEIYGEGPLREELTDKINKLDLSKRIKLMGNNSNVLAAIKDASLFVLTSDYEGIPNTLIEAMCLGIPCVSTDCSPGGAAELIKNGFNGYLVPCNNIEVLADSMDRVLGNDTIATKFSVEAKKLKNRVDVTTVACQWIDVFSGLMR